MPDSSSSLGNVFLSFRGIDTRKTLVGHLYKALDDRGIVTFKDDMTITTGKPFPEEILTAIQNSSFAIIVISRNFTSSKWCLIELKSIMELWRRKKIIVVPVFYEVEPSDLRKENGHFWKPLKRHRRSPFAEEVPDWKEALKQVSRLQGKDPSKFYNHATMIEEIVGEISRQLLSMLPVDLGHVVGMLPHMERLDSLISITPKKVRMIGICGMGGVGKTTIAKYLYERYYCKFPTRCFIEEVWKIPQNGGLVHLQKRLVSGIIPDDHAQLWSVEHGRRHIKYRLGHQRVFVVFDGVNTVDQIQAVAKETSMFGQGSRIIITTRDKSLLRTCGIMDEDIYEVHCLGSDDSLLMFKHYACPPSDAYEQLSIRASQLAHGLPYALEAFGSCFHRKTTISEWENEVERLEKTPHENTMEILKTSYNDLSATDKNVFLHVACLFNGDSVLRVTPLLRHFEFGIEVLSDKSLINISPDGYIRMHNLVEQTGKQIVRQESEQRPHKQLILWDHREISKVLRANSGTDRVQCLALHMCEMSRKLAISCINFRQMHSLKILKFYKHLADIEPKLQFVSKYRLLSPNLELELRLLHWDSYPSTALPFNLDLECLVEIKLRHSNLRILWDGTPELINLRRLDVTGSKNLRELPNIRKAKKLEELLMNGCTKLKRFPEYIGSLSNLVELHAIHCDGLRSLPIYIRKAKTLQEHNIIPCQHIVLEFPDEVEPLRLLPKLSIEGKITFGLLQLEGDADHFSYDSGRQTIPYKLMMRAQSPRPLSSFCDLKFFQIKRNKYYEDNPPFRCHSLSNFPLLTELNMINLKIENIPSSIGELQSLEKLNLNGNDFVTLPGTMEQLSSLKYLNLCNCCKLEALPPLIQVEKLILSNCISLQSMLELSTSEEDRGRYSLLELKLDNCNKIRSLSEELSHFSNLKELDLSRHDFSTLPENIKELSLLRTLTLNNCRKLESMEKLPLSLKCLYAHGCYLLENVSLSSDHSLEEVDLQHCFRLKIDGDIITRFPPSKHGIKKPSECTCSQYQTTRHTIMSLPQIKPTRMVLVIAIAFTIFLSMWFYVFSGRLKT